jgi:hypothetical protein
MRGEALWFVVVHYLVNEALLVLLVDHSLLAREPGLPRGLRGGWRRRRRRHRGRRRRRLGRERRRRGRHELRWEDAVDGRLSERRGGRVGLRVHAVSLAGVPEW